MRNISALLYKFVKKQPKPLPSQDRLKAFLSYDPKTGKLWWHQKKGAAGANSPVDYIDDCGYIQLRFDGKLYRAHRIIWRIMTGDDPGRLEIDHKNSIRDDNRWKNLRIADMSGNMHNTKILKRNTSGFKGVSWSASRQKWCGYVTVNWITHSAGRHLTLEAAVKAVRKLRKSLHTNYTNHGGVKHSIYSGWDTRHKKKNFQRHTEQTTKS